MQSLCILQSTEVTWRSYDLLWLNCLIFDASHDEL